MSGPFKMKNQDLAASAKYKTPINYNSPAKNLGVFVDGERVTRAEGLKADQSGGNVTWTNKDADWKLKQDLKSDNPDVVSKAESSQKVHESSPEYKGEKGKEKEFNQAKRDDEIAQKSTEYRAKIKSGEIPKSKAGNRDDEGYTRNRHGQGQKAFDEKNKNIKTEIDDKGVQLVKGSSHTLNTEGANPDGQAYGTKNTQDYKDDKRKKAIQKIKDRQGITS